MDRYDSERFLDYKMGCVFAMLDCLCEYDPVQGIKNLFRHGISVVFYKAFSYLSVKVYFVVVIAFRLEKRQDSMSE